MTLFNWLKKAILLIGSKSSASRTDAVRVNDKNAKNQNASWKRWVLSEALEAVADDDCLMFNGNLFHLFYSFGPATEYLWPNKQSMWTYGPKYRVFRTMVLNTRTYRVCGHMVLKTRHTDHALSPNDAFSDREEKWWHHISEIMGCHWIEYSERTRWKQSPQIIP